MSAARQLLNQKIRDPTCDFRDVFLCLKQLTNLNRSDWGNKIPSPLIVGVEFLRQDLVVLMVRQFNVDVNSVDKIYSEGSDIRARTALHRAVDMNNSAMVMQLLRLGADPIKIEAWCMLPHVGLVYGNALENAIFARYYAVSKSIEYFIKKEQEKNQINAKSIKIIIGTPRSEQTSPTISIPEVREEKKRQSLIDNFNEKVYEFFELNTEFKGIESRISGEKRPKMDQIKTMESYMNQQRDRKNFIEYDDLKVLEQHLSDYLILQTDTQKDKTTEKEEESEKEEIERIRQQLMQDLKTILQCSQCCHLAENDEMSERSNSKESEESKMYSCTQGHLICNTCLQNVKIGSDDVNLCPMCIQNETSNLRRNFLAEKLIEAFAEVQFGSMANNNNNAIMIR